MRKMEIALLICLSTIKINSIDFDHPTNSDDLTPRTNKIIFFADNDSDPVLKFCRVGIKNYRIWSRLPDTPDEESHTQLMLDKFKEMRTEQLAKIKALDPKMVPSTTIRATLLSLKAACRENYQKLSAYQADIRATKVSVPTWRQTDHLQFLLEQRQELLAEISNLQALYPYQRQIISSRDLNFRQICATYKIDRLQRKIHQLQTRGSREGNSQEIIAKVEEIRTKLDVATRRSNSICNKLSTSQKGES